MNDDKRPLIVIKKFKRGGAGGHGGAWKIAYADFVTAMMAFFLLMWLLGSTSKGDLHGIADYFQNPMRVSLAGGTGSGDASSVIQGGGTDIARKDGQIIRGEMPVDARRMTKKNTGADEAEMARREMERLQQLKTRVEKAIEASPALNPFKNQIKLDLTPEGLRIQILDEQNRPMFDLGSAHLKDYTRVILHDIAKLLNEVDHKITLSGHTDAKPYASGERAYSNWELSADRANASRRELIAGGMDESKILRVVGLSSAVPFNAADPYDPANRRISIIVTNRKTEQLIKSEAAPSAGAAPAPERGVGPPAPAAASGQPLPDPPKAMPESAVNSDGWPARR